MTQQKRLQDRVAIVTGGASGIGRAIAIRFAREGARVAVADLQQASRLPSEQPDVCSAVREAGGESLFVRTDTSKESDVADLVSETEKAFGTVDILVNSAGVFVRNAITGVSDAEWDRVIGINLKGYFLTCRQVIPLMEKQGKGRIVNISSIHGIRGTGAAAAYCASKGGVENLTRQLAFDYAKKNITVNAVCPGTIETAMSQPFRENPVFLEEYQRRTLLPRLGKPEDVANATLFLASDEAEWITGHSLVVDGGWTIA